ncbi:dTDP-glucose 4,6-dehydratase [Halosegnis rubeus]|uniref:dTDP-glucose 4,6-dehydratase n=1 Tax=Halosegnis rubeus TaxID=2212850 RepID=A0A5N5UGW0_9EURY|nr:dTDP-glucose 4,6-dehydratase [Halosegnis rubeus]KAB7517967.1 dTDP-glucose 4,6-dehydratase [Halosegnis rubeus]
MNILVTGGAGFIGSNYVRHVLEATDAHVTTVDALTYAGNRSNFPDHDRHEFVEGDITNRELVNDLVVDADQIVNFAAESHVDRSIDGAATFVQSNVEGVATLLDACVEHGIDRFVQISTDEVYGEIAEGEFVEGDKLTPRNPYAATKAGADLLSRSYHVTHDVPVVITRSSNNYGPRQHTEKLIPKLIRRASNGDTLPIYGDGSNVREWTYVTDNCRAVETVRQNGETGEVYNIGSGDEQTNLEIARTVCAAVDASEDLIEFVEDRPGHDQRYALDTQRVRTLGWEPTVSFEEGLAKTVAYYRE